MSNPIKISIVKCVEVRENQWYEVRMLQYSGPRRDDLRITAPSEDTAKLMGLNLKRSMESAQQVVLLNPDIETEYH